jgi:predicted transcriptional regulator
MAVKKENYLTKREQQIMEIIYQRGHADVAAVMVAIADPLSNSAVRTHLRILEAKGHLKHREEGGRFVYTPTKPRQRAAHAALATVLRTFFDDSVEKVMATLLSDRASELKPEELDRLQAMIDRARESEQPASAGADDAAQPPTAVGAGAAGRKG